MGNKGPNLWGHHFPSEKQQHLQSCRSAQTHYSSLQAALTALRQHTVKSLPGRRAGGNTQLWAGSEQLPALWCMSERGFGKSALWWIGMRLSGRFGSTGRTSLIVVRPPEWNDFCSAGVRLSPLKPDWECQSWEQPQTASEETEFHYIKPVPFVVPCTQRWSPRHVSFQRQDMFHFKGKSFLQLAQLYVPH